MKKTALFAGSILAVASMLTVGFAAMNGLSDESSFDSWFAESAQKMNHHEVITGYEDGSFRPTNTVNRAELAVMLDRFATAIGKPLQTGPTMCTLQFVYGLNIQLMDNTGMPLEGATISVAGMDDGAFEGNGENGMYSGLGEMEGHFTFTISKDGYTSHTETVRLEKDACHVIPQTRTITLIKL